MNKARELFNNQGIDNVSLRDIAGALDISPGNLSYHFPTRENLIESLYFELVDKMDKKFEALTLSAYSFKILIEISRITFQIMYEYKFLMLDFVSLMRNNPKIKDHYREVYSIRKVQFRQIFNEMIKEGYLKPEQYPGQLDKIITLHFIIGDSWVASAEILYDGPEEEKTMYYQEVIQQLTLPYLTEKGLDEINRIFAG